jgi:hypothetical protein
VCKTFMQTPSHNQGAINLLCHAPTYALYSCSHNQKQTPIHGSLQGPICMSCHKDISQLGGAAPKCNICSAARYCSSQCKVRSGSGRDAGIDIGMDMATVLILGMALMLVLSVLSISVHMPSLHMHVYVQGRSGGPDRGYSGILFL